MSALNSSVKNNGAGANVALTVGAEVAKRAVVAGTGAVVGEGNSTCVGTGVELLQAVRNIIPTKVVRSMCFLVMTEL